MKGLIMPPEARVLLLWGHTGIVDSVRRSCLWHQDSPVLPPGPGLVTDLQAVVIKACKIWFMFLKAGHFRAA